VRFVIVSKAQTIVPYVCHQCKGALRKKKDTLVCDYCGSNWDIIDSVPCFVKDAPYWGELPQDAMKEVVKNAQEGYWKDALEKIPEEKREELISYGSDETRGWWRYLLPGCYHTGTVLDIGAGLGAVTFSLANAGYKVVAIDSVRERINFIETRKRQDKIRNIQTACASALALPFPENAFDIVILNGVLEWLGLSNTSVSPDKVQKKALINIYNLLKSKGIIYLAIENRISALYFLGFKDPHSGLRFTTLMPRIVANVYARIKKKTDYRTYIYSKFGYQRMLKRAGFKEIQFFLPLPSYRNFKMIVPMGDRKVTRYGATHVWSMKRLRFLRIAMPLLKLLPVGFFMDYFGPDYSIIARK
jgi:ubiquinone/menaquinone biosynthesis C-methylase UbiE